MAESGKIGCFLLTCVTRPLAALPLGFHRACGRMLGRIAGGLLRYRRDVVMVNLARSFPDKKYDELQEICRRTYQHFGKILSEAIWFGGCNEKRLRKSGIAHIDNIDLVNALYDKGRSVIALGSHSGNWEILGGYRFYGDVPFKYPERNMCVVYRRLGSAVWDRFMMENRKAVVEDKKNFDGVVESFQIMRYVIRHRGERMFYNMVSDQYPYSDSSKVKVDDFMSQPTVTMDGGAALAHRLGMAVVHVSMKEDEKGCYRIHFNLICENAAEMDETEILNRYYSFIEADLKEQPWNYLWTHKRWK